jgi:cell division protein FtsB
METVRKIGQRMNEAVLPGFFMLLIAYFGFHAIQGEWGLIRYLQVNQKIALLEIEAGEIGAERQALEHRVALISHIDGVDPDLLDEQARYMLGFTHPEELVIFTFDN